jgi:hypothetical protein
MKFYTGMFYQACISGLFFAALPVAGVEWKAIGPDTLAVNCLSVRNIIDSNYVLAGTDKGLYFIGKSQIRFPVVGAIPVRALKVQGDVAVATASNGTSGDGAFWGKNILKGEPYWLFTPIDFMVPRINQQAALLRHGTGGDTIFIGFGNNIGVTRLSGIITEQQELVVPQNSFGIIQPYCAALHLYSHDKKLYAGGYDQGADSGKGGLLIAKTNANDTMLMARKLKVTAIAEGFSESGGLRLYIATRDSGVFHFNDPSQGSLWEHIPAPNNEAIHDMVLIPTLLMSVNLCVAVNSGAYFLKIVASRFCAHAKLIITNH